MLLTDDYPSFRIIRLAFWDAIAAILYCYFDGGATDEKEEDILRRRLSAAGPHRLANELEWHLELPPDVRIVITDYAQVARFAYDSEPHNRATTFGDYACMLCGQVYDLNNDPVIALHTHVDDEHSDFLPTSPEYDIEDLFIYVDPVLSYDDWMFCTVVDDFGNDEGITKHYYVDNLEYDLEEAAEDATDEELVAHSEQLCLQNYFKDLAKSRTTLVCPMARTR